MISFLSSIFGTNLHYFFSRGAWLTLAQSVGILAALITSVFMANTLDESVYGLYRYMIVVASVLGAFSLTGAGQAIFQAASRNVTSFLTVAIKQGIIYSTPLIVVAVGTSIYYYSQENYTLSIACLIIAVFQPLIVVFQGIIFFLQGIHNYKVATSIQISKSVLVALGLFITLSYTHNPLILFLVYLGNQALVHLIAYKLFKPVPIQVRETDARQGLHYLRYARHSSIRNILSRVAFGLDSLLVFQQLGAAPLAIYSIGNMLPEQIKGTIKNLSFLILQKFVALNNPKSIKKALPKRTLQLSVVLILMSVVYCIVVPFVYPVFFPKYPEAVLISQLVSLSFPAYASLLSQNLLKSQMEEKILYTTQIITDIGTILLVVFLTLFLGIIGAVLGKVLGRYLNLCVNYYYANKLVLPPKILSSNIVS